MAPRLVFRILMLIKNPLIHFSGDVQKNSYFENFKRFPEKRFC